MTGEMVRAGVAERWPLVERAEGEGLPYRHERWYREITENVVHFNCSNGWTVSALQHPWGEVEAWAWTTDPSLPRTARPVEPFSVGYGLDAADAVLAFVERVRTWAPPAR